jgi:hypothetical protein
MVADVRFAVLMRLRRELEIIKLQLLNDRRLWGELVMSRTDPQIAKTMCARYRGQIHKAFPGCGIMFQKTMIGVKLPDGYPNHAIPVCEQLSPRLIECFTPAGLTKEEVGDE